MVTLIRTKLENKKYVSYEVTQNFSKIKFKYCFPTCIICVAMLWIKLCYLFQNDEVNTFWFAFYAISTDACRLKCYYPVGGGMIDKWRRTNSHTLHWKHLVDSYQHVNWILRYARNLQNYLLLIWIPNGLAIAVLKCSIS